MQYCKTLLGRIDTQEYPVDFTGKTATFAVHPFTFQRGKPVKICCLDEFSIDLAVTPLALLHLHACYRIETIQSQGYPVHSTGKVCYNDKDSKTKVLSGIFKETYF